MFDFYNTHFLIAGLAELSKGISLFTSVCAKFACVFLMGLFGVAFGLFVVPRFGVGYRHSGLNGRCRFDCREGHRWHEGRERQNGNEFLHKLKGLNTAQLGLSTFPGIGRMLTSPPLWRRASPGARRDELAAWKAPPRQNRIPVQTQCTCNVGSAQCIPDNGICTGVRFALSATSLGTNWTKHRRLLTDNQSVAKSQPTRVTRPVQSPRHRRSTGTYPHSGRGTWFANHR